MTTKHTPGPWVTDGHIHGGERIFTYPDRKGYQVCAVGCQNEEGEANARLIAAAPELLEALEQIVTRATDHPDDDGADRKRNLYHVTSIARAAIAKATGAA